MLKCREVPEEAERLLAGELGMRRRMAMYFHLFMCVHCRRYVRQLRLLLSAIPFLHGLASDEEVESVVHCVHQHKDEQDR